MDGSKGRPTTGGSVGLLLVNKSENVTNLLIEVILCKSHSTDSILSPPMFIFSDLADYHMSQTTKIERNIPTLPSIVMEAKQKPMVKETSLEVLSSSVPCLLEDEKRELPCKLFVTGLSPSKGLFFGGIQPDIWPRYYIHLYPILIGVSERFDTWMNNYTWYRIVLNETNHYKSARFCHKSQKPSCRSGSYLKSKTQENMTWIYIPLPSNSHHQIYPTFSRESQLKPSNVTGILGRGRSSVLTHQRIQQTILFQAASTPGASTECEKLSPSTSVKVLLRENTWEHKEHMHGKTYEAPSKYIIIVLVCFWRVIVFWG